MLVNVDNVSLVQEVGTVSKYVRLPGLQMNSTSGMLFI